MSERKTQSSSGGVGLFTILLVVFVVLKLTGHIDWAWVWVLSPFWIPVALLGTVAVGVLLIAGVVAWRKNRAAARPTRRGGGGVDIPFRA